MPYPGMVAWERSVWLTVCYAAFPLSKPEARCAFALKRPIHDDNEPYRPSTTIVVIALRNQSRCLPMESPVLQPSRGC